MDPILLFLGIIAATSILSFVLRLREQGLMEDAYKFFRESLDGIGVMPGPSEGMGRIAPAQMPSTLLRDMDKVDRLRNGERVRLNCRFPCAENKEGGSALLTEEEDGSLTITIIENHTLEEGRASQSMASVRIGPTGTRMISHALADGWNGIEPPEEYVDPIPHDEEVAND